MKNKIKNIGIALSGGGVRAMAFHAGLLRYLAEKKILEQINQISTVSGGSLLIGLIYSINNNKFPTSNEFIHVSEEIKSILTQNSLQDSALMRLIFNPKNWHHVFSRAHVIADTLESCWGIKGKFKDIPSKPVWSINATTAETGKRFRFKNGQIGDYTLGYASSGNLPLSQAMAVSAAFPGGIGPLRIKKNSYIWNKRISWDSSEEDQSVVENDTIHLYDGGVYDNLGIEPLFDSGAQQIKKQKQYPIDFIIVSDAGLPLVKKGIPGILNPLRFNRIFNIILDQTRALRVRSFMNFIKEPNKGAYIYIGTYTVKESEEGYSKLTDKKRMDIALYPTTLARVKTDDYEKIEKQGYETTKIFLENRL